MESARYIIASGPSGVRLRLADHLANEFDERIAVQSYELWDDGNYRGSETDYRYAVKLAATQATWENQSGLPVLFTHSLLDGLAYATLTTERHLKFQNVSEYTRDKALLVLALIGAMFRDSFKADQILFLNLFEEDDERYEIQERIRLILDEFQLPYTELTLGPDGYFDLFDHAKEIIGADLDGARRATSEPS